MNTVLRKIVHRKAKCTVDDPSASISALLQRIYSHRGVSLADSQLTLKSLPKPDLLPDISVAAALLANSIQQQEKILIVGDYDADGATSTALALLVLRAMGAKHVDYLIPDRVKTGYGLSPEVVALAVPRSPDLLITVDNGISSVDGVMAAKNAGIKVVVTDHHLPGAEMPQAEAIVNPNCAGSQFATGNLAGVGVIFYLLAAVRVELRKRGWFKQQAIAEPSLLEYCDLIALGTVADLVRLDKINRILVEAGLRIIRQGKARPGIQALFEVAQKPSHSAVSSDLGFSIGPRINAAGRIQHMSLGVECLIADDMALARRLAGELDVINLERRQIESTMQDEAAEALKQLTVGDVDVAVCLYQSDWHEGIIGLLASRIKQKYQCPVIIFAQAENGQLKGSGRSVEGIHLRDLLDDMATRFPGLLSKFGGHAMAAGMSMDAANLDLFQQQFVASVKQHIEQHGICRDIVTDGKIKLADMNIEQARELRYASPWGQGFPEPLFDGVFQVISSRVVGQKHLKLIVTDAKAQSAKEIDAIFFNAGQFIEHKPAYRQTIKIVYKMDLNTFRGNTNVQLMIEQMQSVDLYR